ncbi:hypothetical protein ACSSVW_003967 [Pseudoalteromonas sp. MBR-15]
MKSFVYISVMFALCGCKPAADSAWQMSSRLSFDGYPINWQAESIKGCEQCEFKKERLLEPDGVSDVITVFQQGQWRAEHRQSHQARIVFENGAHFLLVKTRDDGLLELENKHAELKIITKLAQPFTVNIGENTYDAVISKFEEPRSDLGLSDPLPVKLDYTVLKSQ